MSALLLKKIMKMVAAIGQISSIKCTKFDFDWGSGGAPDPAERANYIAPPDLVGGLLLREWREGRRKEGKER